MTQFFADPSHRLKVETALTALAGLLLLIVAALFLIRQIQPTVLELDARAAPELLVELEIESSGDYIPYYISHPERARIPEKANGYATTPIVIVNEGTPFLHLLLNKQAGRLELHKLRLRTLFGQREWSADQLPAFWMARGGITRFQVENDALIIVSNGQDASLSTRETFAPEIDSLQQTDGTILSVIAVCTLALFGLRFFLWWRWGAHAIPQLSLRHGFKIALPTSGIGGIQATVPKNNTSFLILKPCLKDRQAVAALLLILLLFMFGAARVVYLTTHHPLVGYANTGDFYRLLACYGMKAIAPFGPYDPRNPQAPITTFARMGNPIKEACYLSSQTFLIDAALIANSFRGSNNFDLQALGIISAIFLCALCGGLIWLFAQLSRRHAIYFGLCFAFLFSDPFVTLFANTFLSEFAATCFAIASVALAIYILLSKDWSLEIAVLLALSVFSLGTSRLQNLGLPLLLTAWLALVGLWHRKTVIAPRRILVTLLIVLSAALVAFGLEQTQNARPGYMSALRMVNRADTYYGALLPALHDPRAGLELLGLRKRCAPYIGKTWYDMQDNLQQCARDARGLPATAFLRLIWQDPMMVAHLTPMMIDQTRPWIISYVGNVEGGVFESFVSNVPSPRWSLATSINALSGSNYRWLISFLGVGAVLAGVVLGVGLFRSVPARWSELALLQWLMTAIFLYIVVSALLGDGFLDFAKHTFLGKPALLLGDVLGLSLLVAIVWHVAHFQTFWGRFKRKTKEFCATAGGSTTLRKT